MSQITEAGKYLARAIPESVDLGSSKNGTEQISVQFVLLDATDHGPTDSIITWIGNFANAKGMEITAKALKACGWRGDLNDMTGIDEKVVELDVQWDEYQGQRRLRVKWINVPGAGGIVFKDKIEGSAKASLAAKMAAFMKSRGEEVSDATGKVDDLPF